MALWYYGSSQGQHGPVEEPELRALIAAGTVQPHTLVWRDGMADWQPAQNVPELGQPFVQPFVQPYLPPSAGGAPGYYPPVLPTSGLAVASMVCGIVSLLMCYLAGIVALPAVICGHMALSRIRQSPVPMGGRGMAIAGLVLGYIGVLVSAVSLVFVIVAIWSAPAHYSP